MLSIPDAIANAFWYRRTARVIARKYLAGQSFYLEPPFDGEPVHGRLGQPLCLGGISGQSRGRCSNMFRAAGYLHQTDNIKGEMLWR